MSAANPSQPSGGRPDERETQKQHDDTPQKPQTATSKQQHNHDNEHCGNSMATPYNTRASTFLSKDSSVTIFSGSNESKEPSFVSVDTHGHVVARLGALPETSPHEGDPLMDASGELRELAPRNVKLEQYYPDIEPGAKPEVDVNKKRRPSIGGLTAVQSDKGPEEKDEGESEEQQEDKKEKSEEESAEVFSTQVDEKVLEDAKKRQETQRLSESMRSPSMTELVCGRAEEHFTKGLQHEDNQEYEKAIQCFIKAINLKRDDLRFYLHRAECYFHICDFQSSILNYKKACVLEPDNEELYNRLAFTYYFYGQCLFDQKLFPEALEAFSRATEMRPEVMGYHTRSIACLAALQRHGECLALVNKRLEQEQKNADLFILRARLHQLFRNTTLSYYDTKDALAVEPDHPEAVLLMTQLQNRSIELKQQATQLSLIGRHRDALQKISLAIETNPSVADFHVIRGALHRRLSDFNAAIDDYLLALDKTDHDETSAIYQESQRQLLLTYNDFAVECFTKGYYEEAIILLNKAIKGEKQEMGLYINRGDCFFKQGEYQFAMADYQQALEQDQTSAAVRSRIAVIHNEYGVQAFQEKTYVEAENRFSQAIQNNPRVGQYFISRSRTRQMMENASGAQQDVLIALLLDPGNAELMPILTRMLPGKSIKDIMMSRPSHQAKKALEQLIAMATPSRAAANESSDSEQIDDSRLQDPANSAHSGITSATSSKPWKPDRSFPSLKYCMEERDFNLKIAKEKSTSTHQVRRAINNRQNLQPVVGKLRPLPEPVAYIRQGGRHAVTVNQVQVKQTSGWRNFGLGIGVPDVDV